MTGRARLDARASRRGFTLLEVMVSLAILAMALTSILTANARNVVLTQRAKMITIAVQLLRLQMIELEDDIMQAGFPEADEERSGSFDDVGHPEMRWAAKITKVELPVNQEQLAQATGGGKSGGKGGGGSSGGSLGGLDLQQGPLAGAGSMITQSFEMFRGGLEASIRHVKLEVSWNESPTNVQKVDVQTYLTAPGKLDAVLPNLGGGGPSGGAAGAAGAGAAGSSGGRGAAGTSGRGR